MADVLERSVSLYNGGYVALKTYTPWNMVDLHIAICEGDLQTAQTLLNEHDLAPVNAARASFDLEKFVLNQKDIRLLSFLANAQPTPHSSPFRHNHVTLEVSAPLLICRQWWRHVIGAATTEEGTPWSELCLSGEQKLRIFTKKGNRSYRTVKHLAGLTARGRKLPQLRSVGEDGTIVVNQVKAVWETGQGKVYRVTLENGFTVDTTMGHRYLTPSGYRRLEELHVGDSVMANGIPAYRDPVWLAEQYLTKGRSWKDIAAETGASVHTIHKWTSTFGLKTEGPTARLLAHNNLHGVFGKGETAKTSEGLARRGQKVRRAHLGKPKRGGPENGNYKFDDVLPGAGYRRALKLFRAEECQECGSTADLERHHVDRNPKNNDPANVAILCQGHHALTHGRETLLRAHAVRIQSIEYLGEMPVYEIEMENEPNFVAGGIVVHNSRRYVRGGIDVWVPDTWRKAPENAKQGSAGPVHPIIGDQATATYMHAIDVALDAYDELITLGVAPEQARAVLPQGTYTTFRWTPSIQALALFLTQRLDSHAQVEIQDYAKAVAQLVLPIFPHSLRALVPDGAL